ncbi:MAG: hypothetical protein J2P29_15630, partial [Actinobacteria bacterium]|nr:hypothetical protein [Actinomycetota bacterium]
GDVNVAVVPGIGVYLDLSSTSGSVRSDLDEVDANETADAATVTVRARTFSGDVRVTKSRSGRRDPVSPAPADAA